MVLEMPQLGLQSSLRCGHYFPNLIFHHNNTNAPHSQVPNISAHSPMFGATINPTSSHALAFPFYQLKILAILLHNSIMIHALPF